MPSSRSAKGGSALAGPRGRQGSRVSLASAEGDAGGQAQDPGSLVFCFDFDGVVCDSVNESSVAAWLHARKRWPEVEFGDSPEPFLEPMRQMRPVVETGWENSVLVRMLGEAGVVETRRGELAPKAPDENDPDALPMANMAGFVPIPGMKMATAQYVTDEFRPSKMLVKGVLEDWDALRAEQVEMLALNIDELIREFGEVRDRWIAKNKEDWLSRNQPYEGVPDCMQAMLDEGAQVFVITTKQRRFCAALLEDFGLELPEKNLFSLEDGPKIEVLKSLLAREDLAGRTFHFIEDKLSTLRRVAEDEALSSIHLHLVDWGYNTPRDRKLAGSSVTGRIAMLSASELESLAIGRPWL